VDPDEVHNFSLTDMKTVAEFVVGLHDRLQFRDQASGNGVNCMAAMQFEL
jgi:hypothetical protein